MPEFFKQWLQSLTDEQANEMWSYLDGAANCIDMVEVMLETHKTVVEEQKRMIERSL